MRKKNNVKSYSCRIDGTKKTKKKPIYEIQGFVLEISEDVLQGMLREASKPKTEETKD